jgi:hypothetical protein
MFTQWSELSTTGSVNAAARIVGLPATDVGPTSSIEDVSHITEPALPPVLGREVTVEQLGELPRPTECRAVTAVDLVGRDPETVANHGP